MLSAKTQEVKEFMAEENKKPEPRKERDKLIDVTKPKKTHTPPPQSNIDASRVSAHTLREQQALEKLKRQAGTLDQRESRMKSVKTAVAIILIIILLVIAIIFMILIGRQTATPETDYDIRLSVKIDGKGSLSYITDTGTEKLNAVFPGDTLDISAFVRNSNMPGGDGYNSDDYTPPSIFVRFKIVFILDYEERYDILLPDYNKQLWYRYDPIAESKITNGVTVDDRFYYYKGALSFLEKTELFKSLGVNGEVLDCSDGGKYGQIQVIVESIEANTNNLVEQGLWPTAPKRWVLDITGI